MTKIVFVGDEPSETNVDPNIAFVGAKSFNTLVKWIKFVEPDYYICLNSNTEGCLRAVDKLYEAGFKVVTLGRDASLRVQAFTKSKIFYSLPHPSGLNRQLNDKTYIENKLETLWSLLHE